jgi:transcriptional regulator NrdR family protein
MKLIIDGEMFGEIEIKDKSISIFTEAVEKKYKGNGNIIVSIIEKSGKKHDFLSSRIIDAIDMSAEEIEIITATPKEIAIASVYDAVMLMENIKYEIKSTSELLLTGKYEEGMVRFSKVVQQLSSIVRLVNELKNGGIIRFTSESGALAEFMENTDSLNEMLCRIEDALNLEDWILTSDILDFELMPVVEKWQEAMPRICEDIINCTVLH